MSHLDSNKKEFKLRILDHSSNELIRNKTNKIIEDLSLFGHSINKADRTNKSISRRFGVAVKNDIVSFAWNPYSKKSIVAISPQYEIVRLDKDHIKIQEKRR